MNQHAKNETPQTYGGKVGGQQSKTTYQNYTINRIPDSCFTVLDVIRTRTVNDPISMGDLAYQVGVSERHVRLAVEILRKAGIKILSGTGDPSGYWMAGVGDDFERFINQRCAQDARRRDLLAKMLQPSLFEGVCDEP
jgi:biotin operon repressor